MSSLKKHTFTLVHPSIALHDFTPNAAFLNYDPEDVHTEPSPEKQPTLASIAYSAAGSPQNFSIWLNHYLAAKNVSASDNSQTTRQLHAIFQAPKKQQQTTEISALNSAKTTVRSPDFWLLTQQDRTLVKGGLRISLTAMESALIKKMLNHEERVVSKEELIRNIGREPELYRGLEMCLSRLQEKFKRVNDGERLFRSVRNRGYCLTQKIKKSLEHAPQRR